MDPNYHLHPEELHNFRLNFDVRSDYSLGVQHGSMGQAGVVKQSGNELKDYDSDRNDLFSLSQPDEYFDSIVVKHWDGTPQINYNETATSPFQSDNHCTGPSNLNHQGITSTSSNGYLDCYESARDGSNYNGNMSMSMSTNDYYNLTNTIDENRPNQHRNNIGIGIHGEADYNNSFYPAAYSNYQFAEDTNFNTCKVEVGSNSNSSCVFTNEASGSIGNKRADEVECDGEYIQALDFDDMLNGGGLDFDALIPRVTSPPQPVDESRESFARFAGSNNHVNIDELEPSITELQLFSPFTHQPYQNQTCIIGDENNHGQNLNSRPEVFPTEELSNEGQKLQKILSSSNFGQLCDNLIEYRFDQDEASEFIEYPTENLMQPRIGCDHFYSTKLTKSNVDLDVVTELVSHKGCGEKFVDGRSLRQDSDKQFQQLIDPWLSVPIPSISVLPSVPVSVPSTSVLLSVPVPVPSDSVYLLPAAIPVTSTSIPVRLNAKVEKNIKCPVDGCSSRVSTYNAARRHMKKCHEEKRFVCPFDDCDQVFSKLKDLKIHAKLHNIDTVKKSGDVANTLVCSYEGCHELFDSKNNLLGHMKLHSSKRVVCTFHGCSKTFTQKTQLAKHLIEVHEIESVSPSIVCFYEGCEEKCASAAELARHSKTHVVPYSSTGHVMCGKCSKEFPTTFVLKTHETLSKNCRPYGCLHEGCHERFSYRSGLISHGRTHTGEKPYVCKLEGCDEAFVDSRSLTRHKKVHEKLAIVCPYQDCGVKFTRQREYQQHVKNHQKHVKKSPKTCEKSPNHLPKTRARGFRIVRSAIK